MNLMASDGDNFELGFFNYDTGRLDRHNYALFWPDFKRVKFRTEECVLFRTPLPADHQEEQKSITKHEGNFTYRKTQSGVLKDAALDLNVCLERLRFIDYNTYDIRVTSLMGIPPPKSLSAGD